MHTVNHVLFVLADLFCQVKGLDYGYSDEVKVSFKDELAWNRLAEKDNSLNHIDLELFTADLDMIVDEVKKMVEEVYPHQDENKGEG